MKLQDGKKCKDDFIDKDFNSFVYTKIDVSTNSNSVI